MLKNIFLLIILLFLSTCGRKQKNIFNFSENKQVKKINKLELDFVKNVNVKKIFEGNLITWNLVNDSKYTNLKYEDKKVLGYKVYRLVNSLIISKKPLNKNLINTNFFLDKQVLKKEFNYNKESFCYIVRAVFEIRNQVVEGPTSQVVCSLGE